MNVVDRGVAPVLLRHLQRHKVVVLEGARAVGKTTVAKQIATGLGGDYFDLADQATLRAFSADAEALLVSARTPVVVDEAQLLDSLTLSVKRVVDGRAATGQVLLTGSSRLSRGALGGSDPLAGRAVRVPMYPLTVAERGGSPTCVVDRWFDEGFAPLAYPEVDHEELVRIVVQGGLPGTVLPQPGNTSNRDWWLLSSEVMPAYVESALSLILGKYDADRPSLVRTVRYLAANPSQILNVSRMASDLEMSRVTARRYLELLSDSMLAHLIPAERPSAHKAVTAHPKLAVFDTGFAAWAAGVAPDQLLLRGEVWGGLVENLVGLELLAQSSWAELRPSVGHWRQGRDEVDLVLTDINGRLLGIEVKAARSVSESDAGGLRALSRRVGDRMIAGVVLYWGNLTYQLSDRVWAVPIPALWAGNHRS